LNYCRSLRFEDKPDYLFLRKLFKKLFVKEGFEYDYLYDWCLPINVFFAHLIAFREWLSPSSTTGR